MTPGSSRRSVARTTNPVPGEEIAAEQGLEMLNGLARHVAGEGAVTELAQALRQAFDRYRAKEPQHIERVCVQRRLARSVGDRPTEAKVRRLVAWVAGRKEIEFLKPTDKAIQGMASESSGRNNRERKVPSKCVSPRGRAYTRWVKAA